ncbi:hypothetical protein COBT_001059 [Conglomerata obtusa]
MNIQELNETMQKIWVGSTLFLGILVAFFGLKYYSASLYILITIAVDVLYVEVLEDTLQNFKSVHQNPFLNNDLMKDLVKKLEYNKENLPYACLMIALLLSILILKLCKRFKWFNFSIIALYLYREIFYNKVLLYIGMKNDTVRNLLFIISLLSVGFAFHKYKTHVLLIYFGFIGTLLAMMSVETLFKINWGFYKAMRKYRWSKPAQINLAQIALFVVVAILNTMLQHYLIERTKKKMQIIPEKVAENPVDE